MSDIKGLREISNDPFGKLLTSLSKKFSAFLAKDQAELVENPEDIYSDGQDVESALKYHDFAMGKKFDLITEYYSAFEPDQDKLRLWIQGKNLGNTLRDYSEEDRVAIINGDPILVDGAPFDWGISDTETKSIAMRMNRPRDVELVHDEFITVEDNTRIRVSQDLATGISFFIRFRVFDLEQDGGRDRTLFEATDTTTQTQGVEIRFTPGGKLKFHQKNDDVEYNKETALGTIVTNTVYDLWCTYAKSGNVQHIYLNNVDKTLSTSDSPFWHEDTTNTDKTIFSIGQGTSAGNVYGDLYDFRIYREKVVSATEVSRMWTNKWSISNIPFGQVAMTNYSASNLEAGAVSAISFTSTSFSPTSFTRTP